MVNNIGKVKQIVGKIISNLDLVWAVFEYRDLKKLYFVLGFSGFILASFVHLTIHTTSSLFQNFDPRLHMQTHILNKSVLKNVIIKVKCKKKKSES